MIRSLESRQKMKEARLRYLSMGHPVWNKGKKMAPHKPECMCASCKSKRHEPRTYWNKGKTKETDVRIARLANMKRNKPHPNLGGTTKKALPVASKTCVGCNKTFNVKPYNANRKYCTPYCYHTSQQSKINGKKVQQFLQKNPGIREQNNIKVQKALKGVPKTFEHRVNSGFAQIGKIVPQEVKDKISASVKKLWKTQSYREKRPNVFEELWKTAEFKNKVITAAKKPKHYTLEQLEKKKQALKKYNSISEVRESAKARGIKMWKSPEYRKKVLGRREMSFYETRVAQLISERNLPYKFVGNGTLYLQGKCPDFIDVDNKIIIECYGSKQKERFLGISINKYEEDRRNIFAKEGYTTLFLNETHILGQNWKEKCMSILKGEIYGK